MKNPILSAIFAVAPLGATFAQTTDILNVSYDPTRELYTEINAAFEKHWKEKTGKEVTIAHPPTGNENLFFSFAPHSCWLGIRSKIL